MLADTSLNRDFGTTTARLNLILLCLLAINTSAACIATSPSVADSDQPERETQTGLASFYHPSLEGSKTASGERFDNDAMVAAHPTYPLGTLVRVTNLEKEGTVEVRITDRGPTGQNQAEGVIIDLSGAAAEKLLLQRDGRARVRVEVLEWGPGERR